MGTYEKGSRFKSAKQRLEDLQNEGKVRDPWLIKKIVISRYLHIPILDLEKECLSFEDMDKYYLGIMCVIDAIDMAPFKSGKG